MRQCTVMQNDHSGLMYEVIVFVAYFSVANPWLSLFNLFCALWQLERQACYSNNIFNGDDRVFVSPALFPYHLPENGSKHASYSPCNTIEKRIRVSL